MSDTILALDAGGTSVKAAVLRDGLVLKEMSFPFSDDELESLLLTFRNAFQYGLEDHISVVGMACPGPFDFIRGVSLMVHKWRGLKDISLIPLAHEIYPKAEIHFLHDSTAFLLGEAFDGAASAAVSPAGVMLGTGLGFTYMLHRRVALDATQTPTLRLWNSPWRDGIAEDYVSRRALRSTYARNAGIDMPPDVKEIALLARAGDHAALLAFQRMGEELGGVLTRYLPETCDMVVIGGQIARSLDLFLPYIQCHHPVVGAAHIADAAIRGIGQYCLRPMRELIVEV